MSALEGGRCGAAQRPAEFEAIDEEHALASGVLFAGGEPAEVDLDVDASELDADDGSLADVDVGPERRLYDRSAIAVNPLVGRGERLLRGIAQLGLVDAEAGGNERLEPPDRQGRFDGVDEPEDSRLEVFVQAERGDGVEGGASSGSSPGSAWAGRQVRSAANESTARRWGRTAAAIDEV